MVEDSFRPSRSRRRTIDIMSTTPIRTAVLGYGLAGRVFHCPFVAAVPGLELSAIVVANPDRAAAAAARYPDTRILPTAAAAFADPTLDLIVVGTPNDTHFALASAALHAGKHVVIDKPFAATSAEARQLITLAATCGRIVAPFHNRRHDGDFLTVQKLIADQTLGRIVQVVSRLDRYRPLQRPNTWKEVGGPASGNLYDLGPHLIDQAVALFGLPTHITANIRHERDITDIDDAAEVILDFTLADGRALRYTCGESMLAADPAPRFRVHGSLGSYAKYGVDQQEPALIAGAVPPMLGSPEPWFNEPEANWGTLTLATKRTEPVEYARTKLPTQPGDYRAFYANVRDAILGTAPLAIPSEDGFHIIRLLELAVQSSKEQRTIAVDLGHAS
jgi:scyllo-inositol 2-dehydrogenase (NADP+)